MYYSFGITLLLLINSMLYLHPLNAQRDDDLIITHGVASGDVTDHSAVVWSRVNREAQMHVEYYTGDTFSSPKSTTSFASRSTDFTAHAKLDNLVPDSLYNYRVWFAGNATDNEPIISDNITGTFRTAPESGHSTDQPINFVIGGDLGAGNYCRRLNLGYSVFSVMKELSPDFFVFNGDQINADDHPCSRAGPPQKSGVVGWENIDGNLSNVIKADWTNSSELHSLYLKRWEYNRNDTHLQGLLKNTSLYSQSDDHEVINNYGGDWSYFPGELQIRSGYPNIVKAGMDAFFNFSPIDRNKDDQNRIYRSFNWGEDMELFILDAHSYRSLNNIIDTTENRKTLLGKEQLEWLKRSLFESDATWKIISTPVPVTIPNCEDNGALPTGCNNWATDGVSNTTFVRERSDFFEFLDDNNIANVVFIVTDQHFPATIQVNDDFDNDGDRYIFHELVTGPLSAPPLIPKELDPTVNASYLYNENAMFTFGHLEFLKGPDNNAHIIYTVYDENGIVRPYSRLHLIPEP